MRKSIYVKEEDLDIFEWAEQISEDSLSSFIVFALRKLKHTGELPTVTAKENKINYLELIYEEIVRIRKQQGGDYN